MRVPSNLRSGTVYEDVNYPGANGRNSITGLSIGIEGVTVELYNSLCNLLGTRITDSSGDYAFVCIPDGSYSDRVLNSAVNSNRGVAPQVQLIMPTDF